MKEADNKPKAGRKKEMIKIRRYINETENKKIIKKINKIKSGSSKNQQNSLAFRKLKREKTTQY